MFDYAKCYSDSLLAVVKALFEQEPLKDIDDEVQDGQV